MSVFTPVGWVGGVSWAWAPGRTTFATTSPIYVIVANQPIRSRADARYFLSWIDRLDAAVRVHQGWNTEVEQEAVLGHIAQARVEFEKLLADTGR